MEENIYEEGTMVQVVGGGGKQVRPPKKISHDCKAVNTQPKTTL